MRIKDFSRDLSEKYRKGEYGDFKNEHLETYRVVRKPATLAALKKTLSEVRHLPIQSLLDLGAGPATGWEAAKEIFPSLKTGTLVEKDKRWETPCEGASWIFADLKHLPDLAPHDMVLFCYSIGEIPEKYWAGLLEKSYMLAVQALVIVEPGTPEGFKRILKVRDQLLSMGAHILAPCPHAQKCPMPAGKWCHFAARTARTSEHRKAKEGSLGYEDEKYSYIIVSSKNFPSRDRVVNTPIIRSGHVALSICASDGQIKNRTYSRSQGEIYKKAKKLEWGSVINEI